MTETDIDAAATLLSGAFPSRDRREWLVGLHRLRDRVVPAGRPRFGLLLENEDGLVGILLTIYSQAESQGAGTVRCHFSSWYVDGAHAAYSTLLVSYLLKDKEVTYVNISPAPHTRAVIEAQGFRPFGSGWCLTLPSLRQARERVRVIPFTGHEVAVDAAMDLRLLEEHRAFGCVCLLVDAKDGCYPFVFTRRRRVGRYVATSHLLYCRDIADFARFAGPLGRALLRHGIATVIVDGEARRAGLPGLPISRGHLKYVRGPGQPRPGDDSYSELAIFAR